jgi:DNA polymerase-1
VRTLLIDADLLVYRFAFSNSFSIAWDEVTWSMQGDLGSATRQLDGWIEWVGAHLNADHAELFLSDPRANWRHDLYPDYKGTRAAWQAHRMALASGGLPPKPGPQRPILYGALRDHLVERGARWLPSLEGDDMIGLWATAPTRRMEQVIVSVDKDLKTVPGLLFNPDRGLDGVVAISEAEAARYHLTQTLTGDTTDNYPGCKGIGPVKAAQILDRDCSWSAVVKAYEKIGLSEADALVQARIARVLQHGDYDADTRELTLWEPKEAR